MDAIRKALGKFFGENKSSMPSPLDLNGRSTELSNDSASLVLTNTALRQGVSYWACSKLCAIFFVAGVVFGYTLRGRVKRWASKGLKRLTDN